MSLFIQKDIYLLSISLNLEGPFMFTQVRPIDFLSNLALDLFPVITDLIQPFPAMFVMDN